MFIRNCLTGIEELVTLKKEDTIQRAIEAMKRHRLKSIPVIDSENKFVGILSKEGLFELLEQDTAKNIDALLEQSITQAIAKVQPLTLDNKFEETFPLIVRYPFVPIIDENNHFLGIVKRNQITKSLESSFGVGVPGIRLLIGSAEIEGRLEKILELAHNLHLNIITAVTFDAGDHLSRRILLKIEHTAKKEDFQTRLEKHGFKILTVHED